MVSARFEAFGPFHVILAVFVGSPVGGHARRVQLIATQVEVTKQHETTAIGPVVV